MSLVVDLPGASVKVKVSDLEKIGAGGEGSVYLFRHQAGTFAIKRYHHPSQDRLEKLEAAIAARPANAIFGDGDNAIVQMAWPLGLVKERGNPLGFVMPYVDSKKAMELDYFISPVLAKDVRHLEKPNLASRLQIAQNLCSVVNSLHEANHYFIDFKPQNIKVYPRSRHICLIDCDSFSVSHNGRRYPASAYSPQFINPIALVNDQPPSALGEEQDNWAIAVALFMLFNLDLHPYDGRPSSSVKVTTVDDFVRMGLYPYGSKRHPLVKPKPSSVHHLWPAELQALFDRAFTDPQRAPAMSEWVQYLQNVLQNKLIARCDTKPNAVDHLKFLGHGCMQCAFESRQKPPSSKPSSTNTKSVVPPVAAKPRSATTPQKLSFPYNVPIPNKTPGDPIAFWGLLLTFSILSLVIFVNLDEQAPVNQVQSLNAVPPLEVSPPLIEASSPLPSFFYHKELKRPLESTMELNDVRELRWCMYERYRLDYLLRTLSRETIRASLERWRLACLSKSYSENTYQEIMDNELAKPDLRRLLENAEHKSL